MDIYLCVHITWPWHIGWPFICLKIVGTEILIIQVLATRGSQTNKETKYNLGIYLGKLYMVTLLFKVYLPILLLIGYKKCKKYYLGRTFQAMCGKVGQNI